MKLAYVEWLDGAGDARYIRRGRESEVLMLWVRLAFLILAWRILCLPPGSYDLR